VVELLRLTCNVGPCPEFKVIDLVTRRGLQTLTMNYLRVQRGHCFETFPGRPVALTTSGLAALEYRTRCLSSRDVQGTFWYVAIDQLRGGYIYAVGRMSLVWTDRNAGRFRGTIVRTFFEGITQTRFLQVVNGTITPEGEIYFDFALQSILIPHRATFDGIRMRGTVQGVFLFSAVKLDGSQDLSFEAARGLFQRQAGAGVVVLGAQAGRQVRANNDDLGSDWLEAESGLTARRTLSRAQPPSP
jgi:hypothetical protein